MDGTDDLYQPSALLTPNATLAFTPFVQAVTPATDVVSTYAAKLGIPPWLLVTVLVGGGMYALMRFGKK